MQVEVRYAEMAQQEQNSLSSSIFAFGQNLTSNVTYKNYMRKCIPTKRLVKIKQYQTSSSFGLTREGSQHGPKGGPFFKVK